jgi:hypothetical protein
VDVWLSVGCPHLVRQAGRNICSNGGKDGGDPQSNQKSQLNPDQGTIATLAGGADIALQRHNNRVHRLLLEKKRGSIMASSWSITINQQDGQITFTPDVPGARTGQPLGVNSSDNVTWNNRTNQEITLKSTEGDLLCDPMPAGNVSNPIFNVTATVGYSWVRQHAPQPAQPDAWILVVS